MTTELCRAPENTALACPRDLDVLEEPLEARIGIGIAVALLVQHGTVVDWSLASNVQAPAIPGPAHDVARAGHLDDPGDDGG